jgi:hypothetical protein
MKSPSRPFRWLAVLAFLVTAIPPASGQSGGPGLPTGDSEADDEIIGEFVLVIGKQSSVTGPLEGANMSGLALEMAGHSPGVRVLLNPNDPNGSRLYEIGPGGLRDLLAYLLTVGEENDFMMLYTPGAMRMNAGGQSMIWTAGSPATMSFADHDKGEYLTYVPLDGRLDPEFATSNTLGTAPLPAGAVGAGQSSGSWALGDRGVSGGVELEKHRVNFDVMMGQMGFRTRQHHEGHVWVAPEHPGAPIVAAFYNNFAGAIANAGWFGDFAGGLTQVMGQLAAQGLPMRGDLEITTRTRVVGIEAVRLKSTNDFEVDVAWVLPLNRAMWRYLSTFEEEIANGYKPMEIDPTPPTYMSGEETQGVAGTLGSAAQMWKDQMKQKFKFGKRKKKDGG